MKGRQVKPAQEADHVIMQMRKNISMNGSKPIKFADGDEKTIPSGHAAKVLSHYSSLSRPAEKEAFQKHIGGSHRNLSDWLGGKKFVVEQATEKPDYRDVNNDEIFGSDVLRESSTLRTVKSLKYLEEVAQRKIERAKFRSRLADIIASA